jgi:hypothetical protein
MLGFKMTKVILLFLVVSACYAEDRCIIRLTKIFSDKTTPIITVHYKEDCVAFDKIDLFKKWVKDASKHTYFKPLYKYQVQDVRFEKQENGTLDKGSLDQAIIDLKSDNFDIEIIPGG